MRPWRISSEWLRLVPRPGRRHPESARKDKKIIAGQTHSTSGDIGKVDDVGLVGTGQIGGMGGLRLAVGAVAGDDQCLDSAINNAPGVS